ncbi:MAG: hypothetical protein U0271_24685 [Polyangiaceae bacterium]
MRARGARSLLIAVVTSGLLVFWVWARLEGRVAGPDGEWFAELSLALIPVAHAVFGLKMLRAAKNEALSGEAAQLHRLRLETSQPFGGAKLVGIALAAITASAGVLGLFLWATYPRHWSDAWSCGGCSDGEGVCCDVVAPQPAPTLFILACIVVPLAAIAALPSAFGALHYLTIRARGPAPIVEVDADTLTAGELLRVAVRLFGPERLAAAELFFECVETARFSKGSTVESVEHVARSLRIASASAGNDASDGPLELRADYRVPADAMHSFKGPRGMNSLGWRLRLVTRADASREHVYPITISAVRT